jgi:hypothetical protein
LGHAPHARSSPRAARRGLRPHLEWLEDRSLLSLFSAPIPYAVSPGTGPLAAADFNGDGRTDLAVTTNVPSGTHGVGVVNVLLRTAGGTYSPPVASGVGGNPAALAVADFFGDGRPDLAVAQYGLRYTDNSAVALARNNGDGSFSPAGGHGLGSWLSPVFVAVGDFNGDGRPDLVDPWSSAQIQVWLNHGDGTFGNTFYNTGPTPTAAAVADLNGDGKPDLAVLSSPSDPAQVGKRQINVLLNDGGGTFTPGANVLVPSSGSEWTAYLVAGDFNGDGKQDLAVTDPGGNAVVVLPGHGDGTFGPAVSYAVGARPGAIVAADFTGSGKPDLAVTDFDGGRVVVLPNNGDDTFAAPLPFAAGTDPQYLAAADLNGDGLPDLAVSNTDGSVRVLLNRSRPPASTPGVFDPATGTCYLHSAVGPGIPDAGQFPYGGASWLPVAGDWDGNGAATVGVVDPATATWYLRNENSSGAPDVAAPFPYGLPGWVPVVGDWSGTGHAGIGMFDPATGTWYLRNEDSPGAPDAGVFQYGGVGWLPVVGDWTGSGRTTIGVVDPSTMTWYLRNSNSSGAPDIAPFSYGGVGWKPVTGDWSGGGTTTVGVIDPNGVWYLRNSTSAGAPDFAPFPYGLGSWAPVAGGWAAAGAAGAPRAAVARGLPQTLDGSSASSGTAPAFAPASSGNAPASAAAPAPAAGSSAQPSRSAAVRQALLAGQARAAALDELFAAGLG